MTNLVFISLEHWDDIWRRNQFVCAELARRHPTSTILFVTPPRDVSNALRRGKLAQLKRARPWSPRGLPNVVVSTPSKYLPSTLGIGRRVNAVGLRRHLLGEMRRLSIRQPALWINDHAALPLVGGLGERSVVYDITDDWISFDQPEALRERTRQQDAALCRRADATIVCSKRLHEMKQSLVPPGRLHLVPNGVDASHYADVCDASKPVAPIAERWPKPVFGYTGTVHPDRVDVDLLERMAKDLTAGSVVLVGPDHLTAEQRQRLLATGRVIVVGPIPYHDLPAVMRAFDVCIVPHRVTPFTESLNPIKLWEYLAAGKPIVSTSVAGFRDYPAFVSVVADPTEFLPAMVAAVAEDPARRIARQAEAAKHSWASRVDEIERIMSAEASSAQKLEDAA